MKKKRYRNRFAKGTWMVLVHLAVVTVALCIIFLAGAIKKGITLRNHGSYVQSDRFEKDLYNSSETILSLLQSQSVFSDIDGNTEKVIDLQEVIDGTVLTYDDASCYGFDVENFSNENTSGLAYSADKLKKWAESSWGYNTYEEGRNVLICEKPDGTYHYCYYSDFAQKTDTGELKLVIDEQYLTEVGENREEVINQAMDLLRYGQASKENIGISHGGIRSVEDAQGNVVYVNIWNYSGEAIIEKYAPEGATSILDVLNTNPKWNGRIAEAYAALQNVLVIASNSIEGAQELSAYQEGNTNLSYLYVDKNSSKVFTNKTAYDHVGDDDASIKEMMSKGAYIVIRPQLSACETNLESLNSQLTSEQIQNTGLQTWLHMVEEGSGASNFIFAVQVDTEFPVSDSFSDSRYQYDKYAKWFILVVGICTAACLFFIIGFIWLTAAAGRKPGDEEIHLCAFDRWFTEFAVVLPAFIGVAGSMALYRAMGLGWRGGFSLRCIYIVVVSFFTTTLFLTGYLSLLRRHKAKTLWKNSIFRWLPTRLKRIFLWIPGPLKVVYQKLRGFVEIYSRNTGSKVKMTLLLGAFLVFQIVANGIIFDGGPLFLIVLLAVDAAIFVCLLRKADGQEKTLEGLKRISGGELQYKIPLAHLTGEQKVMAEYINNIGAGLDAAVESSLKNERMKTELITNVSHDIKTPLTSIINYVGLLKRENFKDEKICSYLDILENKAQRLKNLTEDVVEASKASTGNITLEMSDLDFVEMLHQVIGEFEEKFGEKNLIMMVHFTDEPSIICADGQRMWRVLENIFNNVVKYAMDGTRVYAEVRREEKKVIFSLKNISAQPLNISADELTERFIRGDVARNTEGSGLGLSIAKSLTELQGGEFNLYLDGDLFKVIITFTAK